VDLAAPPAHLVRAWKARFQSDMAEELARLRHLEPNWVERRTA